MLKYVVVSFSEFCEELRGHFGASRMSFWATDSKGIYSPVQIGEAAPSWKGQAVPDTTWAVTVKSADLAFESRPVLLSLEDRRWASEAAITRSVIRDLETALKTARQGSACGDS